MSYEIFANHAHVFPKEVRPHGTIEALKEFMKACDIDRAVCFAPFENQYKKSGLPGKENDWLAGQIENDDSLVGFGTINFDEGSVGEQVRHIHSLGFKGIKIHPAAQEINIMSEQAQEVYEAAQELRLFLSFHTGIHWHRISDYNMLLFDEVAWHFPFLKFSMEHLGGYCFFKEGLAVMSNNKRNAPFHTVFAGLTTIHYDEGGKMQNWTISDEELVALIDITGNERSIFGLDFPYHDVGVIRGAIERIRNLNIPDEAKEGILGKNLNSALYPEGLE